MKPIRCFILLLVWLVFSGSNAPAQDLLTLDEARQLALQNNREIKVARENTLSALSLKKASRSLFFPTFDMGGQYLRMNKSFNLLDDNLFLPVVPAGAINFETGQLDPLALLQSDPSALIFDANGNPVVGADGNFLFSNYAFIPQSATSIGQQNNFFLSFNMAQPLYTGGKIRAQYRAAQHTAQMIESAEQLTRSDILLQTDTLFWKMVVLQEKKELAVEYVSMLEYLVKDVENYTAEGITSTNDLLKARVALNEARYQLTQARNGVAQVNLALNRLMGMPMARMYVAKPDSVDLPVPQNLETVWEMGLEGRPEITALTSQAGMAQAVADGAKASLLPNVALGANYFTSNPNPYSGFSNSFGHDWVAGLTVSIPVYHFGEKRNLLRAARHEVEARQQILDDTHDLIRLDIAQAWYNYSEALEWIGVMKLSAVQAAENLKTSKDLFDVGKLRTTDLLEAQTLWHQAQVRLIESKAEAHKMYAALQKATASQFENQIENE